MKTRIECAATHEVKAQLDAGFQVPAAAFSATQLSVPSTAVQDEPRRACRPAVGCGMPPLGFGIPAMGAFAVLSLLYISFAGSRGPDAARDVPRIEPPEPPDLFRDYAQADLGFDIAHYYGMALHERGPLDMAHYYGDSYSSYYGMDFLEATAGLYWDPVD
ncbi:hypothetical protein CYMTET_26256 [Cymbomonas tetramitiformis]|uniref:Uncharacterized protein n=1 Tax=Cymbomonas tetramitiformis TaxID=36881 RepID=A0AAE0KYD3_9CHLO|nr:hypothetical protein CYMTET_26256 [Cymbomonas tetramitiformis]